MARRFVVLALLALAASSSRADDWKWDPLNQAKAKDEVGDKFFREEDETEKQAVVATVNKKPAQNKESATHTVFRLTGETLKAEKDKATEQRFKIEKWSREAGEELDSSLEGKTITVKGTGADKTWDCEKKDDLSEGAKAWIEKELAKKPKPGAKEDDEDEKKKLLYPEKPVADGDERTRDPESVAKGLFGEKMLIDKEKSSFKGKLTKVHVEDGVHYGHVEFKLSFKLKASDQWSEGGTIEITFQTDGSLEEHKRQSAS